MSAQPIPIFPPPRESYDSVLGKNLVVARTAAGLTQQELADAANVSRATIAQLEAGYSDPRLSTVVSLASAMGISPFLLLWGREEVQALTQLPAWLESHPIHLPPAEVEHMRQLLRTGMLKDRARAARVGASLAAAVGHGSGSDRVGAAVFSAFLPGDGTKLGIALSELLDAGKSPVEEG